MLIAQVKGTVVATKKADSLTGSKLLIVRQVNADGQEVGQDMVAVDTFGAGKGELVLCAHGSSARALFDDPKAPIDLAVVGIIDSTE